MQRLGQRGVRRISGLLACVLGTVALAAATPVQADDPPAAAPVTPAARPARAAGGLLGGVRPPAQTPEERAEGQVADELAEVAAAPGHEAAAGVLVQARAALARARELRVAQDPVTAARALAVARAALELAGRQAALARERAAAAAAGRARDAALARAHAAHEALLAAQRESARVAETSVPVGAEPDAAGDGGPQ